MVTDRVDFNGANVCLILEKRLNSTPEYLLALHIVSDDFSHNQEITVHWTTTIKWGGSSGIKHCMNQVHKSYTFTKVSGEVVLISPTPSPYDTLDVTVNITSWIVSHSRRSTEYSNTQTKFAGDKLMFTLGQMWDSDDPEDPDHRDSPDNPFGQTYSPKY